MNPKGTRDLGPSYVSKRDDMIAEIVSVFESFGGKPIDTPIIEQLSTVTGIYGENFDKEVYELNLQGEGEKLILRYDLTVPLARYIASNGIDFFKRYQIGRVLRRDTPKVSQGRYREFYQCDFDIIGPPKNASTAQPSPMIQENEILQILITTLNRLIGCEFIIKINSKPILFSILENIGIDKSLFQTVCSTIDKLNKKSNNELYNELLEKGVKPDKAISLLDFLIEYQSDKICSKDINFKLTKLVNDKFITLKQKEELNLLCEYLDVCNLNQYIDFDPTLARGLDYYTGLFYEAKYLKPDKMQSTIAAGGRYDEMLGKLSGKSSIPAIGLSIGLDRIMTILESEGFDELNPSVYVATIGRGMEKSRSKLCFELRGANIKTEMSFSKNIKMSTVFKTIEMKKIPYLVILGSKELESNTVVVKNTSTREQTVVKRSELTSFLKKLI